MVAPTVTVLLGLSSLKEVWNTFSKEQLDDGSRGLTRDIHAEIAIINEMGLGSSSAPSTLF